jgi:transposase
MWWQMDNARPHCARAVQDYFEQRNIKTVWQSPYSPHLNLCDRFLFKWLKDDLRLMNFTSYQEVENAALHSLRQISEDALKVELKNLIDHCQAVIQTGGDYITF